MTDQRKKNILFANVVLVPFIAFAVIEFAPWWVSTPFGIVCLIHWLGSIILIGENK